MVAPRDTTADAWSRHVESWRQMRPQERLRQGLTMSDEVREIARAGIRSRHPDWGQAQVQGALEDLLLGPELAETVRRERPVAAR
jgi:hypothetical protein